MYILYYTYIIYIYIFIFILYMYIYGLHDRARDEDTNKLVGLQLPSIHQ